MKTSVILKLTEKLSLNIEGNYYQGSFKTWEHPGDDSTFEINNVEINTGTFLDFCEWNDEWLYNQIHTARKNLEAGKSSYTETLFEYFERRILEEELINTEPEYEKD